MKAINFISNVIYKKQPTEQELAQALVMAQNKVRSAISHDYHYRAMTAVIVRVH